MTEDGLAGRVVAVVARIAGPRRTPPAPGPETPLAEGGFWLESAGLLEVVLACEAEFGVSFDPERDLTPEGLSTIGRLTETIRGLTRPAP